MMEKPISPMAATKAAQLTEPRDSDFLNKVRKPSAMEDATLNGDTGGGAGGSGVGTSSKAQRAMVASSPFASVLPLVSQSAVISVPQKAHSPSFRLGLQVLILVD